MLAVVTSLFNCITGSLRHQHYTKFKENLGDIPLFTAELAFDDLPFLLQPSDNVLQLRSNTWMWQRDRIVNKLLETVPDKYNNIALIDADILFHDSKWHINTEKMLTDCMVGQLWEKCHHTQKDAPPDISIANRDKGTVHTGYAWAFQREFLNKHGLFDRSPVGGNDVFMMSAYCGWRQHVYFRHFTETFMKYFSIWGNSVLKDTKGNVGHLTSDITHLWHGDRKDRSYIKRIELLSDFNPATDLEIDKIGCYKWATDKPLLHKGVEDYMKSRIKG